MRIRLLAAAALGAAAFGVVAPAHAAPEAGDPLCAVLPLAQGPHGPVYVTVDGDVYVYDDGWHQVYDC